MSSKGGSVLAREPAERQPLPLQAGDGLAGGSMIAFGHGLTKEGIGLLLLFPRHADLRSSPSARQAWQQVPSLGGRGSER